VPQSCQIKVKRLLYPFVARFANSDDFPVHGSTGIDNIEHDNYRRIVVNM
jgi:hypothetical protein